VYFVAMSFDRLTVDVSPGSRKGEKVIRVNGPLTMTSLLDFQTAVRAEKSPVVILDLTQVSYIDSAGLGSVVNAHISCVNAGRHLALVGISDRVRTLFKIARLEHVLDIFPTLDDAEKFLNKPADA
jgi:anti-sigma B factor antagonist